MRLQNSRRSSHDRYFEEYTVSNMTNQIAELNNLSGSHRSSLDLTLMMTSAQVVKTSALTRTIKPDKHNNSVNVNVILNIAFFLLAAFQHGVLRSPFCQAFVSPARG